MFCLFLLFNVALSSMNKHQKEIHMLKLLKKWILVYAFIAAVSLSCMAEPPCPSTGNGIGVTFLRKHELTKIVRGKKILLDAESIFQNLGRYDAVWCSQDIVWRSRSGWNFLRENAPEKLMLRSMSSLSTRPETLIKHVLDYDYINTYHPEWFLLKDTKNPRKADPRNPDNRIRWDPHKKKPSDYNRFYFDVGNEEFQNWAVQRILDVVSGKAKEFDYNSRKTQKLDYPYDGLAFDNVVLSEIKVRFNKPYPNWKYANDTAGWKEAYLRYLRKVHKALAKHGYILVVNFTFYWELERNDSDLYDLMSVVDGIMHEWAVGYGPDATRAPDRHWGGEKWLRCIKRHEAIAKRGLIDWWACYPKSLDPGNEQFRYIYCSFLLVKRPGYSLFYASSDFGLKRDRAVPWYEEYDLPIGEPISERYLRDNCWFRDYTDAKIVVNPTEVWQRVIIDKKKLWLDWTSKKAVNELTLPPKRGRILMPTPYTASSQ
jgi:hypothetical protein